MTIQPKNNSLNYLIDPIFMNVNKLFVYDVSVLIDGKGFFDLPVKNEEEAYEKIIDNNDYTTGNLLDYAYYKKHY